MATSPTFLAALPPEVLSTVGLIGGWVVARATRREIGGAVFAAVGALASARWAATVNKPAAAVLGALYTAAMGGSHPLAKKIGPWPSVLVGAATVATASLVARKIAPRS